MKKSEAIPIEALSCTCPYCDKDFIEEGCDSRDVTGWDEDDSDEDYIEEKWSDEYIPSDLDWED